MYLHIAESKKVLRAHISVLIYVHVSVQTRRYLWKSGDNIRYFPFSFSTFHNFVLLVVDCVYICELVHMSVNTL